MQNPKTNKLEMLQESDGKLLRPDGSPVPQNAILFAVGEQVMLKGYTYKIAHINESSIILEPMGIPTVGEPSRGERKKQAAIQRKIQRKIHGNR